jgi:hypothetical protein
MSTPQRQEKGGLAGRDAMQPARAQAQDDELEKVDEAIKELRVMYEKYFAGVERIEPLKHRDDVKKMLRRLGGEQMKNTARRFRLQTLQATLITFEQHWNRITRQIEEGTFKRDKVRAEKLLAKPPKTKELSPEAQAEAAIAEAHKAKAAPAAKAPAPAPTKAPAAASPAVPAAGGDELKKLHEIYVKTRRDLGDQAAVPLDAFAATVAKQTAAIKSQYKCQNVDFKVAVKDGKAILKATPK